jgi:Fungal protein kinase
VVEGKAETKDVFLSQSECKRLDRLFAKDDKESCVGRGQLVSAIQAIFLHQHRTSVFACFMAKKKARLIYVDRSAAAVTEELMWKTEKGLLKFVRFFEALHHANPAQRGHDTTVSTADKHLKEQYDQWATSQLEKPSHFFKSDHVSGRVLQFFGKDDNKYVCDATPIHFQRTLLGRASRCFIGMNFKSGDMVLIKDQWRTMENDENDLAVKGEAAMYKRLESIDDLRPYLLNVVEARDVPEQNTKLHRYDDSHRRDVDRSPLNNDGAEIRTNDRLRISRHAHHRIVFSTVGNPLMECENPKEFLLIMRDIVHGKQYIDT